jgi:hypothetical protein
MAWLIETIDCSKLKTLSDTVWLRELILEALSLILCYNWFSVSVNCCDKSLISLSKRASVSLSLLKLLTY